MRCCEFGLLEHDETRATPGFILFTPIHSDNETTYLLDMKGVVVHRWILNGFRTGYGKFEVVPENRTGG